MENTNEQSNLFFSLFMQNQNRIKAYILMLVTNASDADDIMQETASVMWQKFDKFQPGTNFSSWAIRIAINKVMAHRKKMKRSRIHFNSEQFSKILEIAPQIIDQADARIDHLKRCVEKLPDKDKELIVLHYYQKKTIKSIAAISGRSLHGLYKVMARINNQLMNCINRKLMVDSEVNID